MTEKVEIYCCYAHEDEQYLQMLKAHLSPYMHKDSIFFWDDTNISAGAPMQGEAKKHLEAASIVLLLVSADFLHADYCYSEEMAQSMQRHTEGKIRVMPVILRPVAWEEAPFGKIQVLPTGAKAVSLWEDKDQVFLYIAQGIAKVAREYLQRLYPVDAQEDIEHLLNNDVLAQLESFIRDFKALRGQIASFVRLNGPKGFSVDSCENQYNKLYGNTLVFLTLYLPDCITDNAEGFVEIVHVKSAEQLRKRADIYVSFTRLVIAPLAKLERLAEQIDACTTTLEFYKQKYFSDVSNRP